MDKDTDSLAWRAGFLSDLNRISRDLSVLMELNRRARSEFDSLSRALVSRQQVRRHTEMLYELKACVKRLGADVRRMAGELEELRKPDKRVAALEDEVRRLGSELVLLRAEVKKEARPGIAVRIPMIESRLDGQAKEIEKVRAVAEECARSVAKHRLMSSKRMRIPLHE